MPKKIDTKCALEKWRDKEEKKKNAIPKAKKTKKLDRNQPLLFAPKTVVKQAPVVKPLSVCSYKMNHGYSELPKIPFLFDPYCALLPELRSDLDKEVDVDRIDGTIVKQRIVWAGFKLQSDEVEKLATMDHGVCSCHMYVTVPTHYTWDDLSSFAFQDWTFCFRFTCSKTRATKCREISPSMLERISPKILDTVPSENVCFRTYNDKTIALPIVPPIYFEKVKITSQDIIDKTNDKNRKAQEEIILQQKMSLEDERDLEIESAKQQALEESEKKTKKRKAPNGKLSKFAFIDSEAEVAGSDEDEDDPPPEKITKRKWNADVEEKRKVVSSHVIPSEKQNAGKQEIPDKLELKIRKDFYILDGSSQTNYQKSKVVNGNGVKKPAKGKAPGTKPKAAGWDKKEKTEFICGCAKEMCTKKAEKILSSGGEYESFLVGKSEADIVKMFAHFMALAPYLVQKKIFPDPTDKKTEQEIKEFMNTEPALDAIRLVYMMAPRFGFDHHTKKSVKKVQDELAI